VTDRTFEIALAGLLHDIGRFAGRAEAGEGGASGSGAAPTPHAAASPASARVAFVEQHLPWLRLRTREEGAARAHRPGAAAEWIVATAERWAAGLEHGGEARRDLAESSSAAPRLVPVLGRAWLGATERSPARMRLAPLAVDHDRLFPEIASERTAGEAGSAYRALWEGFLAEVARLPRPAEVSPEALRDFLPTFAALYEKYAWCIPAGSDEDLADVSLFDHARCVAMVAAALCRELGGSDDALQTVGDAQVRDPGPTRLALLVGDLSGIEQTVYGIASAGMASTLRGRSLAVRLLADAIATRLLERLRLPVTNLLHAGGGQLWLLVHASAEGPARDLADEVDRQILEHFGAGLSFRVGLARVSGRDLLERRLAERWQEALDDALRGGQRRLQRVARSAFDELFEPAPRRGLRRPCRVCGAESGARRAGEEALCRACRDQQRLAAALPRAAWLVRAERGAASEPLASAHLDLGAPLDVAYRFDRDAVRPVPAGARVTRLALDRTEFLEQTPPAGEIRGWWYVGRGQPTGEDDAAGYGARAARGDGAPLFGVLWLDADQLGALFQERGRDAPAAPEAGGGALPAGLGSLSRLAGLSRQLGRFFDGHVAWLASEEGARATGRRWHESVELIFAGGDDLCAVGHWSALADLALAVRHHFARFTGNPRLTLSGGLAVLEHPALLAAGFERSRELERAAKAHLTPGGRERNALAVFEPAGRLSWGEARVAERVALRIRELVEKGQLSRSFPSRLQEVSRAFECARPRPAGPLAGPEVAAQLAQGRWAWVARRTLPRAVARSCHEEWLRRPDAWLAGTVFEGLSGERPLIEYLGVIGRWAALSMRGGRS
jgi:CRISPR-associated protein Cas10/Csm1 subtype III-A